MKILVTGATGLIGKTLCQVLAQEGHELVVLSRQPEKAQVLPNVRAWRWQAENETPPDEAWEGVDAVIHLAGEPVAGQRWTETQKRRIRDSRVLGTRNLIEGLKRATVKPQVFVSASAVGFYGDRGDEKLDESSTAGRGFLSEVCVEWEREAAQAAEMGVRVALVRIGVVLSPQGGALEKMLTPFKLGLGGRLGSGRQWFPWIHLDDIVGILHHALVTLAVNGPINGVAPGVVNNAEFTKELADVLHRTVFLPVPEFALQIMMGEMAAVVLASQRVEPRVALATGYQFVYPQLRPALKALLD
jgi:uncharacterized protein